MDGPDWAKVRWGPNTTDLHRWGGGFHDLVIVDDGFPASITGLLEKYGGAVSKGACARAMLEERVAGLGFVPGRWTMPALAGECYAALVSGRTPEALKCLACALTREPASAPILAWTAMAMRMAGDLAAAMEFAVEGLLRDPGDPAALSNFGSMLFDFGEYRDALVLLEWSCALDPDQFESWVNKAAAYELTDRPEDALASYTVAEMIRPFTGVPMSNRGRLLRALGRFGEAETAYEAVLRSHPDHAGAIQAHDEVYQLARGVVH